MDIYKAVSSLANLDKRNVKGILYIACSLKNNFNHINKKNDLGFN